MTATHAPTVATVAKYTNQTAHLSIGTYLHTNTYQHTATVCGRPMVAGEWREVDTTGRGWSQLVGNGPGFLYQPCQRCAAKLAKIVAADHVAALAEDAQRFTPITTGLWAGTYEPAVPADSLPGACSEPCQDSRCLDIVADHAAAIDEDITRTLGDLAAPILASLAAPRPVADVAPLVLDYADGARHLVVLVRGSDSDDTFHPSTGARWDGTDDPAEFNGAQGSADTYCGRVAYGVTYGNGDGPAATCPDCLAVSASGQGTHEDHVAAARQADADAFAAEMRDAEDAATEQRGRQAAVGRVWVPEDADVPNGWGTFADIDTLTDAQTPRAIRAAASLPNGLADWMTAREAVAFRAPTVPDAWQHPGARGIHRDAPTVLSPEDVRQAAQRDALAAALANMPTPTTREASGAPRVRACGPDAGCGPVGADTWHGPSCATWGDIAQPSNVAAPTTREATEDEFVALSARIRMALREVATWGHIGDVPTSALDRIADDAANALTRYGVSVDAFEDPANVGVCGWCHGDHTDAQHV